jgi:hypothetical protein
MQRNDPDNKGYSYNMEHSLRSRMRIDTRKWILAKMLPKVYGERVEQHHTGDPERPVAVTEIVRKIIEPKADDSASNRDA